MNPSLLLGIGGDVDNSLLLECIKNLLPHFNLKVIVSQEADRVKHDTLPSEIPIFIDADEWSSWKKMGDGVLHIELRKWADAMLVWPASAHCIAKIHCAMADDLITCVCRAWSPQKPLFISPSSHPLILANPLLAQHLRGLVVTQGFRVVPCDDRKAANVGWYVKTEMGGWSRDTIEESTMVERKFESGREEQVEERDSVESQLERESDQERESPRETEGEEDEEKQMQKKRQTEVNRTNIPSSKRLKVYTETDLNLGVAAPHLILQAQKDRDLKL